MEQKYCIGTKSGNILWDIEKMLEDIALFGKPVSISTEELSALSNFHGNPDYAMKTDVSKPLIIVSLCAGKKILIDGNHRLYKAMEHLFS